ncbi:MAG TPA: rod shape-determining protein MreC [Dehalococcoidia bacterium]|jgi:rod shape-determining protein MreC|nr:rod shape-determining protein MreC [Dehalococcoidia bacterium]
MVDTRSLARLSVFAIVAVLLLLLSSLSFTGNLEQRVASFVYPATAAIRDATRPIADVLLNAGQVSELSAENAQLRSDLARVEAEAAALRESAVAGQQVESLLAAVGEQANRFLPASVMLRDPTPARDELVVDRGRADGVAIGQPVLGAGATLIGIVVAVDAHSSSVRLLTDSASAVTAVVQESRVPGALAGDDGGLVLEFIPVATPISEGDLILTSALGGRLPGGLVIGRIASVEAPGQQLFATVRVEPLTDYARIERVLILTDPVAVTATSEEPVR